MKYLQVFSEYDQNYYNLRLTLRKNTMFFSEIQIVDLEI